jgi:hypothetical protein
MLIDHPLAVFSLSLVVLYLAGRAGLWLRGARSLPEESTRQDFGVLLAATLTLLGLVIGFSFSMATTRYDQRKTLEEEEANAIGTEFLRAELLPTPDAAHIRTLLAGYLDRRVAFYNSRNLGTLVESDTDTTAFEQQLWSTVRGAVSAQPTPITALAVSGMNDVINAQGYALAAWRNRIPTAAWLFMVWIAVLANALVGYGMQSARPRGFFLAILPLVVGGAFLFIADIDSPRGGIIRVQPQNLTVLSRSMPAGTAPAH